MIWCDQKIYVFKMSVYVQQKLYENWLINECARWIYKKGLLWPSMTFEIILNSMKKLCVHNVGKQKNLRKGDVLNI